VVPFEEPPSFSSFFKLFDHSLLIEMTLDQTLAGERFKPAPDLSMHYFSQGPECLSP